MYELLGDVYPEDISLIAGLEAEENKSFDPAEYFFDCVKIVKTSILNKKIERLATMFKEETDNEKRREFASAMSKLLVEKNKLV